MSDALAILQRLRTLSERARAWQSFPITETGPGGGRSEILRRLTDIQVALLPLCHECGADEFKKEQGIVRKYEMVLRNLHELMEWMQEQRGPIQDARMQDTITAFLQNLVDIQVQLLKLKEDYVPQPETQIFLVPMEKLPTPSQNFLVQEQNNDLNILPTQSTSLPSVPFTSMACSASEPFLHPPEKPLGKIRKKIACFGLNAFSISIVIHLLLVIIALTWVIARNDVREPAQETFFVTGTGGGNEGARLTTGDNKFQQKQLRPNIRSSQKIAVRGQSNTSIADLSDMQINMFDFNGLSSGISKSIDGNFGGGTGGESGLGMSSGRNLVSSFMPRKRVMGLEIEAENIAVYLDSSGSMLPYLEDVRKQIYKEYPHADIFEYKNISIKIEEGKVVGGLNNSHVPTHPRARKIERNNVKGSGENSQLSTQGRAILKRYGKSFSRYSVGAWMDVMMFEDYDALVVFSDFQDGIRGDRKKDAWEKRWTEQFAKKRLKLYLFSIERNPQPIWQQCVEASGGKIKMMPELGRRRKSKLTATAREAPLPMTDSPAQATR